MMPSEDISLEFEDTYAEISASPAASPAASFAATADPKKNGGCKSVADMIEDTKKDLASMEAKAKAKADLDRSLQKKRE